ncbi:ASCH domain-containing protein [Acinetobacter puyangensis]|nr:ASCH domain-containing protein [Acinetobacter puyangensis]
MMKIYQALSIVTPAGQQIAKGIKTLEIRSWLPPQLPLKDLLIVENQNYLSEDGDEEPGIAVALVDIESVHDWREDEVEAATASYWATGYYAWVISNVRPLTQPIDVMAKRKIYQINLQQLEI